MGTIKEFKTRTGAIYCDTEKKMEYLYVGDYGKENNIKADLLGFKKEINQVPHHNVNLKDKMVVTISTQKGCSMNCMFCDCPKVKFGGNISRKELAELFNVSPRTITDIRKGKTWKTVEKIC